MSYEDMNKTIDEAASFIRAWDTNDDYPDEVKRMSTSIAVFLAGGIDAGPEMFLPAVKSALYAMYRFGQTMGK
jgi:hypothetical protein